MQDKTAYRVFKSAVSNKVAEPGAAVPERMNRHTLNISRPRPRTNRFAWRAGWRIG